MINLLRMSVLDEISEANGTIYIVNSLMEKLLPTNGQFS